MIIALRSKEEGGGGKDSKVKRTAAVTQYVNKKRFEPNRTGVKGNSRKDTCIIIKII